MCVLKTLLVYHKIEVTRNGYQNRWLKNHHVCVFKCYNALEIDADNFNDSAHKACRIIKIHDLS